MRQHAGLIAPGVGRRCPSGAIRIPFHTRPGGPAALAFKSLRAAPAAGRSGNALALLPCVLRFTSMPRVLRTLLLVGVIALLFTPIVAMATGCCTVTCVDEGACGTAPVVSRGAGELSPASYTFAVAPRACALDSAARLADPPPRLPLVRA